MYNHLLTLLTLLPLPAHSSLLYKTHDISSLLLEEARGITYRNSTSHTLPLEHILAAAGTNSIKIRVWVDPPSGSYNLSYALRLGQRVKDAGLRVIVNLHYSDDWADPGKQVKPKAWAGLGIEDLVKKVGTYTRGVCDAFAERGLDVDMVSVGNEVRAGLLWPEGKYDRMGNIARLLTAGAQGVRSSKMGEKAKVMVRLDRGQWSTQEWFYDSIIKAGFDMKNIDVQGISYYPFWDAKESTLENLKTNMHNMARKYGKPFVVAETDWPTKCTKAAENIPASLRTIAFTAEGQTQWVRKVADVLMSVPNGLGQGIMYWEPGWIDNTKCESGGLLFEGDWSDNKKPIAKARSSVNMFKSI